MHIVWLYNERRKANDENEQCFCVGEEKEGREGDDRGGNNGQISHCSSDPRSLAPQFEVLLVQLKHRTSVCGVRTGGLCYRLNVVDVILDSI